MTASALAILVLAACWQWDPASSPALLAAARGLEAPPAPAPRAPQQQAPRPRGRPPGRRRGRACGPDTAFRDGQKLCEGTGTSLAACAAVGCCTYDEDSMQCSYRIAAALDEEGIEQFAIEEKQRFFRRGKLMRREKEDQVNASLEQRHQVNASVQEQVNTSLEQRHQVNASQDQHHQANITQDQQRHVKLHRQQMPAPGNDAELEELHSSSCGKCWTCKAPDSTFMGKKFSCQCMTASMWLQVMVPLPRSQAGALNEFCGGSLAGNVGCTWRAEDAACRALGRDACSCDATYRTKSWWKEHYGIDHPSELK